MKLFSSKYLLAAILIISAILRLWKLASIPPHLTSDEAALGYNAYSILKTAKDEYGQILPLVFKSFGDYKPGLYVYLTVPFVALFGLNEFSVRLPSALAGVFAVWLLYKIVGIMVNSQWSIVKKGDLTIGHQSLAVVASFMLAISPWHIHFSRGAWEANVSLTLTLVGILFFLKAIEKPRFLILSSLFFSSSLLAYQGAKLSTTIVLFVLLVTFREKVGVWFRSARGILATSVIVGIVVAFPIIMSLLQGKGGRLGVFSIFSYPRKEEALMKFLDEGNEKKGSVTYYLFHSEGLNFVRAITGRWFNHLSGRFLFFEGDYQNPRHSAPNHGMLLLSDLIFLVAGFVALSRSSNKKIVTFIIVWLILAPLPAALSRDEVHAIRALNMVIPLVLISSFGLAYLFERIKSFRVNLLRVMAWVFLVLALFGSVIYFLDAYFIHLSKHDSKYWEYGYKQIVETILPIQDKYKNIKVQQSFSQPYIYFLFYGAAEEPQKYDPAIYQKQSKLIESEYKGDVGYVEKLDNICFCAIDWPVNKQEHGALIVADAIRIPDEELITSADSIKLIKEIKFLDGNTAFRVVEIK